MGKALTVKGGVLQIGNAELRFSGRWAPLQAKDKVVGIYLEGAGDLKLRSTFAPEGPIIDQNLAAWTKIKPTVLPNGRDISVGFNSARILWAGKALPKWEGEPAEAPVKEMAAHIDGLAKVDGYDMAHLACLQALNGPDKPMVVAELLQGTEYWLYRYDSIDRQEETLDQGRTFPGTPYLKGVIQFQRISRQAIGWDILKAPQLPPFLISALDIDLRTEDNRKAQVIAEETITPVDDGLQALRFRLLTEIIAQDDTRHLLVTKVADGEGHLLAFDQAKDYLIVRLANPTQKGKPVKLHFEYGGDFLVRPDGDTFWELGVRGDWYPSTEALAGESFTFHGTVRTRKNWIAFLPGETVQRKKEGDWNLIETRTEKPICFATILGGTYTIDEETRDGITLRIATYAFGAGVGNRVLKDQAFNIIRYYQHFLGPFPFKDFTVIEKNQWGYGQAPPGMMYITRDAFNQTLELGAFLREGLRKRFAHEIAHQYWGIVVKMPSSEDQWITESFADYCAALYERDFKSEGLFKKSVAQWNSTAREVNQKAPIPLANDLHPKDDYDAFKSRTYLLYSKGPMLLHALHDELGDVTFLTYLKSIQSNFRWRFATTRQLFDLLKFVTKKDYTPFYQDYFWGLEMPPEKSSK